MSTDATTAESASPLTSYDEFPYPSASFPQSHPSRLAAMACLFGVEVTPPSKARILELGCADGSNLLPMAEQLPGARLLGIDASRVQIASGQKALEAAGLKNVELRHQNILDFPAAEGKFDYIVVHGIFSWVPEPVREKIMAICAEHLTARGIAYISYNALPGWNMRRSLRDMMLFHTQGLKEPLAKVQQARALIKFLSDSVPTEKNSYGILLKSELEMMGKVADNYLRHDYLEEENTPCYFHEFVGRAARHGLQYMSETSLSQMLATNFPETVAKTLTQLGQITAQEQYMDFLRNRMFRQTLLCRANLALNRNLTPERLKLCAYQALTIPQTAPLDLTAGVEVTLPTSGGQTITTADTFLKAVFQVLGESNARALGYDQLLAAARRLARPLLANPAANLEQIEETTLGANLMNLYAKGFIEIHAEPVAISLTVAERPQVSALARYQAGNARLVTNRMHAPLPADALGRAIIAACDGEHSVAQVVEAVMQEVKAGRLNVQEGDKPVQDDKRLRELLDPQTRGMLQLLARTGFFAP